MTEYTQTVVEFCSHPTYTDVWRFGTVTDRVCNHCHATQGDDGKWYGGRTLAEALAIERLKQ